MSAKVERNQATLEQAKVTQATVLGEDLLISFSNGTSVLLGGSDIKDLVLTRAKSVMTEADAARLDAQGLVGPERDGTTAD